MKLSKKKCDLLEYTADEINTWTPNMSKLTPKIVRTMDCIVLEPKDEYGIEWKIRPLPSGGFIANSDPKGKGVSSQFSTQKFSKLMIMIAKSSGLHRASAVRKHYEKDH